MKKLILSGLLVLFLTSCTSNWEYKIVKVKSKENRETPELGPNEFKVDDESLNLFGKDGWELVSVYETLETVHPNFGNSQYVTGIQPNVRTSQLNFVFKRKK